MKTKKKEQSLTKNQKAFCEHYVTDRELNATKAYMQAYPRCKESSAAALSSKTLRKVKVQRYLKKLREAAMKRVQIKQDDILQELKTLGFSNIKDFLEYDNSGITLYDSKKVDTRAIHSVKQQKKTRRTFTKDGGEVVTSNTTVELKMHQKLQALVKLGEHLGLWDSQGKLTPLQVIIKG